MSYLSRPRAHFLGSFGVSTPTANNNNYFMVLDPEKIGFFDPFAGMDDAAFRQKMETLVTINFDGFFGLGIEQVLQGNWNFYGDNSISLTNASIFAIDTADGQRITSPSADPLIGAPVQMFGDQFEDTGTPPIMVDCDPTSDLATQIFCSRFLIGQPGCMCQAMGQPATPLPRAFSRWIYIFYRNLVEVPDATFSAVWQHALPNANLTFDNGRNSPALQALQSLAAQGNGLQVRYCTYFFKRKFTDVQMAQFYQAGNFVKNESAGFVLGSIGVWGQDELGSYPGGRLLLPSQTKMTYTFGQTQRLYTLAPAVARVDTTNNVIALDLITAFPEVTSNPGTDPRNLQKIDLGAAALQVSNADGSVTGIGNFAYDGNTYVSGGGIVEVPFSPDQLAAIQAGTLQVVCASASVSPVLAEQAAVVESDQHCVYITEGQAVNVDFRVWQQGAPPQQPIQVTVEQFRSTEKLVPVNPNDPNSFQIPGKLDTLVPNPENSPPPFLNISPQSQMVGPQGVGTLTLTGLTPGLGMVRLMAGDSNPPDPQGMPDWMWIFYVNVRVLPADSQYDNVPDSQLTWDYIYQNVLRYYYRLYPTMDQHLVLNNQQAVTQAAPMLLALMDRDNWNSTLYMPVTRELSDGKRRLLQRWCNLQPGA